MTSRGQQLVEMCLKKTDVNNKELKNFIPSEENKTGSSDSSGYENVPLQKRKSRWKKSSPKRWKRNTNKINKKLAKKPKDIDCRTCKYKCSVSFDDTLRCQLCLEFWTLDYNRQKDFIISFVTNVEPKCRRRRTGEGRPKNYSRFYYFLKEGNKVRVCKKFFLRTLCISHGPVDKALSQVNEFGIFAAEDKRGRKSSKNKTNPKIVDDIKTHIESFPTVESHYCRKSTKRSYLDRNLSIAKMYELYVQDCKEKDKAYASLITYRRIFCNDYNLAFFKPKKDQCLICENYNKEKSSVLKDDYESHIRRRDEANAAKNSDKKRASTDDNFISVTFDLQSVLQIPSSDVSLMYYSRKLCAYNLTIYEAASHAAHCYAWTEINGQRGSSEIGTALYLWIQNLPQKVTEISLFSDTCSGQNRNQFIAALFLFVVQNTNLNVVQHNFLEKGHSYMEVDSMHSAIESAKKNIPVYTMHDWLSIFRIARSKRGRNKTSGSYDVHELHYDNFLDLKNLANCFLKNRTTDINGSRVNWMKIKTMRYEKARPGFILFKYNYSETEYHMLNVFGRSRIISKIPQEISILYSKQIPISDLKKENLLKLCKQGAIPEEFHTWYQSLPADKSKKDTAPEPSQWSDSDSE